MEVTHVNTARCVVALLRMSFERGVVALWRLSMRQCSCVVASLRRGEREGERETEGARGRKREGFRQEKRSILQKNGVVCKKHCKILVHFDGKTVSVAPLTVFCQKMTVF